MRRLLLVPLLAGLLAADDRWLELRSGPFQVLTNAGEQPGQEALGQLEQLRYVLGTVLGKQDLGAVWPVRILVVKPSRRTGPPVPPAMSRDAYVGSWTANAPVPELCLKECVRILIEDGARRMPAELEAGLIHYYSTMQANGPRLTLGRPPRAGADLNWARIHLLSVDPKYYGKLRVLLFNLQQGVDPEAAYRNSFGKTPAEVEKEAAAHFASGRFDTVEASGRPLNFRRDFRAQSAAGVAAELVAADLLLAAGRGAEARAAYEAILKSHPASAEAREGLGLLALKEGNTGEAHKQFEMAIQAGSRSARAHLEFARLTPDRARATAALRQAAELNPQWAEPHFLLAGHESDGLRKVADLAAAARLAPRNAAFWQALAEAQMAVNEFRDAAKSWTAALQASTDDAERRRISAARAAIEERRIEAEAAARRREAEEKERELLRLKQEALAQIRAAEARANRGTPAGPADRKIEAWFDAPAPSGKVRGRLTQVDCLRGAARLVIRGDDGKLLRLAIRDPAKVVVIGGGELSLGCGPQRPQRTLLIEYFPQDDARLGTAGEVATLKYE